MVVGPCLYRFRTTGYWGIVRMLKNPSVFFSVTLLARRDSLVPHIFNLLQPSKMAAHPCAARRMLKNRVFQHPVSRQEAAG